VIGELTQLHHHLFDRHALCSWQGTLEVLRSGKSYHTSIYRALISGISCRINSSFYAICCHLASTLYLGYPFSCQDFFSRISYNFWQHIYNCTRALYMTCKTNICDCVRVIDDFIRTRYDCIRAICVCTVFRATRDCTLL
jgi:hypothetical protein